MGFNPHIAPVGIGAIPKPLKHIQILMPFWQIWKVRFVTASVPIPALAGPGTPGPRHHPGY
jgi:hypothetical protein